MPRSHGYARAGRCLMVLALEPMGYVRGGLAQAVDDNWGDVRAVIKLDGARF